MKLFHLVGQSYSATRLILFLDSFQTALDFLKNQQKNPVMLWQHLVRNENIFSYSFQTFLQSSWICLFFKNILKFLSPFLKSGTAFCRFSLLIKKSFLTNSLSKCGLHLSLFRLSLASNLFNIFLLCLTLFVT